MLSTIKGICSYPVKVYKIIHKVLKWGAGGVCAKCAAYGSAVGNQYCFCSFDSFLVSAFNHFFHVNCLNLLFYTESFSNTGMPYRRHVEISRFDVANVHFLINGTQGCFLRNFMAASQTERFIYIICKINT